MHRRSLGQLVSRLRDAGVDPVIVKGWAVARAYGDEALRSYTDHDVCVRRGDVHAARRVLEGLTRDLDCAVDLHEGFDRLDESAEEDLLSNCIKVDCDGVPVRLLAEEDHLRVICRHFIRHGGSRLMWLCDVAAAVETRPKTFDWDRCLTSNRRVVRWVKCTLQLAHELLGMSLAGTPIDGRLARLPAWLVPTVEQAWSHALVPLVPVAHLFRQRRGFFGELRRHWPNGLQATAEVRAPINAIPRFPFQVAACASGVSRVVTESVRLVRARA